MVAKKEFGSLRGAEFYCGEETIAMVHFKVTLECKLHVSNISRDFSFLSLNFTDFTLLLHLQFA
jgi:hypothetical protein